MVSPFRGKLSARHYSFRPALKARAFESFTRAQFICVQACEERSRPFEQLCAAGLVYPKQSQGCLAFSTYRQTSKSLLSSHGGFARITPFFLIPSMPGAPLLWPSITPVGRGGVRANGFARRMPQRVSHGQQNAHRCRSSGRNPGGGATW